MASRSRIRPFLLSLVALLSLGVAATTTAMEAGPAQWKPDIDAFVARDRAEPPPQHGVLFIGSSSIRFWTTLDADFPGVPTINRGFGGSAIEDATYYADRIVVPYHPKLIVMYAGDNDVADGHDAARVVGNFKAFVARVRRDLPDVPIVYIAIKHSIARDAMWPTMRKANQGIRSWASTRKNVRFVDMNPLMQGADGKPRPALLREDGLHMTPAGYAIWTRTLKPVLADYGFATH